METMPSLSSLFIRFLKLGSTAYGGPGMIGQIKQTTVNECGWLKEEEFLQGLGFIQAIPGGTVPQMVAYVGYRVRGHSRRARVYPGLSPPPVYDPCVLSIIYFRTRTLWFRVPLFKGLSAIVVAIVLDACLTLGKPILRDWQAVAISILSFIGLFFRVNILVILASAGLAAFLLYRKGKGAEAPARCERPAPEINRKDLYFLGLSGALICSVFGVSYFIDPRLTYLCLRLAKIGTIMFGGGFTVIPLIQYEVVDKFHWISTKEFMDGIALGQLTPGPMMITAFIGNQHSGLPGAMLATVALMSPSFLILLFLLPYHDWLRNTKTVRTVQRGILASFIGMLGLVLYNFGRTAFIDIPTVLLAGAAFFALVRKVGLPYIILVGGILSLILFGYVV